MDDETSAAILGYTSTGVAAGTGSGTHGYSPILTSGGVSVPQAVSNLWAWLNEPFKAPLSPVGLAMIVGALLVAVILWNFILYHIRIAAESL